MNVKLFSDQLSIDYYKNNSQRENKVKTEKTDEITEFYIKTFTEEKTLVVKSTLLERKETLGIENYQEKLMRFRFCLNIGKSEEMILFKEAFNSITLMNMTQEEIIELTSLLIRGIIQNPEIFDEKTILLKLPKFANEYYEVLKYVDRGSQDIIVRLNNALEKISEDKKLFYAKAAHIINFKKIPFRCLKEINSWSAIDFDFLSPHLRFFDVRGRKDTINSIIKYSHNIHKLIIDDSTIKELPPLSNCQYFHGKNLEFNLLPNLINCNEVIIDNCQFTSISNLPNCEKFTCFNCPILKNLNLKKCKAFHLKDCPKLTTLELPRYGIFDCSGCLSVNLSESEEIIIFDNKKPSVNRLVENDKFHELQTIDLRTYSIHSSTLESVELSIEHHIIHFEKGKGQIPALINKNKSLGVGSCGRVFEQKNNPNRAIKISVEDLRREYRIGHRINHPNIVKSHRLYQEKWNAKRSPYEYIYWFNMDTVQGKYLMHFCQNGIILSDVVIKNLIVQINDCCTYLFKNNIAWKDLNDENIFIENEKIKFLDLGRWKEQENKCKRLKKLIAGSKRVLEYIISISSLKNKSSGNLYHSFDLLNDSYLNRIERNNEEIICDIRNSFDDLLEEFDCSISK